MATRHQQTGKDHARYRGDDPTRPPPVCDQSVPISRGPELLGQSSIHLQAISHRPSKQCILPGFIRTKADRYQQSGKDRPRFRGAIHPFLLLFTTSVCGLFPWGAEPLGQPSRPRTDGVSRTERLLIPPSKPVLSCTLISVPRTGGASRTERLSLLTHSPGLPHLFGQTPLFIQLSSSTCPLYIRLFRTYRRTVAQNQIIVLNSLIPSTLGVQARCARGAVGTQLHETAALPLHANGNVRDIALCRNRRHSAFIPLW